MCDDAGRSNGEILVPSFAFIAHVVHSTESRRTVSRAVSRSSRRRQHANKAVVHQRRTDERVKRAGRRRGDSARKKNRFCCIMRERWIVMPRSRMARSVRYFRHGRSTWRHIFRTCRHRVTPNTRSTTGGSLNDNLARVCVSLSPFSHFFSPFSVPPTVTNVTARCVKMSAPCTRYLGTP